jgi:hypothetical protein
MQITLPEPHSAPTPKLAIAQDAFLCCQAVQRDSRGGSSRASSYISTSYLWMWKHTNQQHSVKLTRWSSPATASYKEHAGQLWKAVKVQTFFQEPCNVCYFVVQEEEAQEEQHQQQGNEQQESEQQSNYKQRLALFSLSLEALKHKDSKAIDCIAEETSAKNCTGWFKRM